MANGLGMRVRTLIQSLPFVNFFIIRGAAQTFCDMGKLSQHLSMALVQAIQLASNCICATQCTLRQTSGMDEERGKRWLSRGTRTGGDKRQRNISHH